MARFNNRLDHVRVAAPCKADWDQMIGDERVRFCSQCSLNVFNLSGMTRANAESLIARTEGRLCVSFYRRSDGSIITRDCPIGLRAIRRRMSYVAKAISSAMIGLLSGLGVYGVASSLAPLAPRRTMGVMVQDFQGSSVKPIEPPTPQITMGKVLVKPIRHRRTSGEAKNDASNQ